MTDLREFWRVPDKEDDCSIDFSSSEEAEEYKKKYKINIPIQHWREVTDEMRRERWYNDRIQDLERQIRILKTDLSATDAAHCLTNAHLEIILKEAIDIMQGLNSLLEPPNTKYIMDGGAPMRARIWLDKAKKVLSKQ